MPRSPARADPFSRTSPQHVHAVQEGLVLALRRGRCAAALQPTLFLPNGPLNHPHFPADHHVWECNRQPVAGWRGGSAPTASQRSKKLDHCIEFHASYQHAAQRAVKQRYDVVVAAEKMLERGASESIKELFLRSHELLCEARHTLQWSYAYSFYENDATKGELFGIARTGLVKATERMGELLERDWGKEEVRCTGRIAPHTRAHPLPCLQGTEYLQEVRGRASALDKALAGMRRYAEDEVRFREMLNNDRERQLAKEAESARAVARSNSNSRAALRALRRKASLRRHASGHAAAGAAARRAAGGGGKTEADVVEILDTDEEEQGGEQGRAWACAVCTFVNEDAKADKCAMCELPRA